MERTKKLFSVIPESLFFELRKYELLSDIDNIITELLAEKIEAIKRGDQE